MINSPLPPSIEAFLDERRRTGADRYDEIWKGVLHVAPAPTLGHGDVLAQIMERLGSLGREAGLTPNHGGFNLGEPDDYRIPDAGLLRGRSDATYAETAALVVEVVSPSDETVAKLPFYAEHGVEEVLIADVSARSVRWLRLQKGRYVATDVSELVALGPADLQDSLDWPTPSGSTSS